MNTDFFGPPLTALTTLLFSKNIDLQRCAALAFAEITEKEDRPVNHETLNPIIRLINSHDASIQHAAYGTLGNFAINSSYLSALV